MSAGVVDADVRQDPDIAHAKLSKITAEGILGALDEGCFLNSRDLLRRAVAPEGGEQAS